MTPSTGEMLQNRYRVVSLLGQGGMGAVYRAWDTRLNVPAALKEMTPQPGLDTTTLTQLRRQFHQEAIILAEMNHPHLVDVTDFFEGEYSTYLVMRFIEGESLASRITREGALPESQVLAWAWQLLAALAYCHSRGVIHRDVKPQNVVITPEGRVVLVDFGLVKLWDPHNPHTRTVMRGAGTPEYAPPEQYNGHSGHTDPRSDLYSLGATLYHTLTGQAPLTATDRTADPDQFVPVRWLNSRVSTQTEAAVLRAMELERNKRFQSAREMAMALDGRGIGLAHQAASPLSAPLGPAAPPPPATPPGAPQTILLPGLALLSPASPPAPHPPAAAEEPSLRSTASGLVIATPESVAWLLSQPRPPAPRAQRQTKLQPKPG